MSAAASRKSSLESRERLACERLGAALIATGAISDERQREYAHDRLDDSLDDRLDPRLIAAENLLADPCKLFACRARCPGCRVRGRSGHSRQRQTRDRRE